PAEVLPESKGSNSQGLKVILCPTCFTRQTSSRILTLTVGGLIDKLSALKSGVTNARVLRRPVGKMGLIVLYAHMDECLCV
ncbi:hypothetical protein KUCAC02_016027, partial [Chaenocephalus aceratus]